MKLLVLAVGKAKEPFYKEGCRHYLEKIRPYSPVELREAEKERSGSEAHRREAYGAVRKDFLASEARVAVDPRGKALDSESFARWLDRVMAGGARRAAFLLGGAHGLPAQAREDATLVLSLSAMTLPHQMARLFLLEQIYRGFTILRGEPYHK